MRKKIISTVVISTVAAGMLIWVVGADFSKLSSEERVEIQTLIQKSKSWDTLTTNEQNKLNEIKADFEGKKWNFMWDRNSFKKGRWWFMKGLSDEEKNSLKEMTDDEKKSFFDEKKELRKVEMEDRKVIREWHEAVIDKLIDWEELNEDEKAILEEIKVRRAERKAKRLERGENRGSFEAKMWRWGISR